MVWFRYIAVKNLPAKIKDWHSGYIHANGVKSAEWKLSEEYNYVLILGKV